jgi:hypothetical protein
MVYAEPVAMPANETTQQQGGGACFNGAKTLASRITGRNEVTETDFMCFGKRVAGAVTNSTKFFQTALTKTIISSALCCNVAIHVCTRTGISAYDFNYTRLTQFYKLCMVGKKAIVIDGLRHSYTTCVDSRRHVTALLDYY